MSASAETGNVSLQMVCAGHLGLAGDTPTTRLVGVTNAIYTAGFRRIVLPASMVPNTSEIIFLFSPSPMGSTPAAGLQPFTNFGSGLGYDLTFGFMLVDGVTVYTGPIDFVMYRIPSQI